MDTKNELQIVMALEGAMSNFEDIDEETMNELRGLNKRFMTAQQLSQLWIIEQKNSMIAGSRKLEKELENKMEKLPTLNDLEPKGRIGTMRVKNYESNLDAIDSIVSKEIHK